MPFPWARPRHELLLLALVGIAALTPIYRFGEQDRNLMTQQWAVLQRLGGALEHYVESRVLEQLQGKGESR